MAWYEADDGRQSVEAYASYQLLHSVGVHHGMPTEIRRINVGSVIRVVMPLGIVSAGIGSLPFLLDFMAARTVDRFVLDYVLLLTASAVTSAVLAAVFATVYNLIATYFGGIEVTLS